MQITGAKLGISTLWLTGLVALPVLANTAAPVPATIAGAVAPAAEHTFTVGQHATAQFRTIQAAVDAAPQRTKRRTLIRIAPGTYAEKIRVPREKGPITFLGESAENTIITNGDSASTLREGKALGTSGSYTLQVQAADFSAENLTIENSAGQKAGQAVALMAEGDRAAFRRCKIVGWQDTLYAGGGRQYYENCLIAGSVDYIFGGATAWFENCRLHSRGNGHITAASTPPEAAYGFVFVNCTITAEPGVKVGLGRTWRPHAAVTFLGSTMPDAVGATPWSDWNNPENQKTARYAEYNSRTADDQKVDVSARNAWARQLSAEEADRITLTSVLGGKDKISPFGNLPTLQRLPTHPRTAAPGVFPAANATIYGPNARWENEGGNLGFWNNTDTSFQWTTNLAPGTYQVTVHYAVPNDSAGSELELATPGARLPLNLPGTGGWGTYQSFQAGQLSLLPGEHTLTLHAVSQKADFILNLREVTLTRIP